METGRGSSTGNHPNGAQDTHGGHGAPEHRGGGRIADLVSPQGALQDQQPRPAILRRRPGFNTYRKYIYKKVINTYGKYRSFYAEQI